MSVYPASIIAFTTKTNKVDLADASHVNTLQEEVVALQTELGKDVAGSTTDLKTRLSVSIGDDGAVKQNTTYPTSPSPIEGQLFYRSDLNTLYIRTDSSWQALGQSQSNVIYMYHAMTEVQGADVGQYTGTSLTANGITTNYKYLVGQNASAGVFTDVVKTAWIKISGVNTLTMRFQAWNKDTDGSRSQQVKLTVGATSGTMTGNTDTAPQAGIANWKSLTVDVSGLVVGTSYDFTIGIAQNSLTNYESYVGTVVVFGS